MKRKRYIKVFLGVIVIALLAAGCDTRKQLEQERPIFDGIQNASFLDKNNIRFTWLGATDDTTSPEDIAYLIYAVKDKGDFSAKNYLTATRGALAYTISIDASGLDRGTTYLFRVNAQNENGVIDTSEKYIELLIPVVLPEIGEDLLPPKFEGFDYSYTITATETFVTLTWVGESGVTYNIYRTDGPGPIDYEQPMLASVIESMYIDNTVSVGQEYIYGIIAKKDSNKKTAGPFTNAIEIIDPTVDEAPTAPTIKDLYATGPNSAYLKWTASEDDNSEQNEMSYTITWSLGQANKGTAEVPGKVSAPSTYSKEIQGLSPGTLYTVEVYAVDAAGQTSSAPHDKENVTTSKLTRSIFAGNYNNSAQQRLLFEFILDKEGQVANTTYLGFAEGDFGILDVAVGAAEQKVFLINKSRLFMGYHLPIAEKNAFYDGKANDSECTSGQIVKNYFKSDLNNLYILCNQSVSAFSYHGNGIKQPITSILKTDDASQKHMALHSSGKTLYLASEGNKMYAKDPYDKDEIEYAELILNLTTKALLTTPHIEERIFVVNDNSELFAIEVEPETGRFVGGQSGKLEPIPMEIGGTNIDWPTPVYAAISPLKVAQGAPLLVVGGENRLFVYMLMPNAIKQIDLHTDQMSITSLKPDFSGLSWYVGYKNASNETCIKRLDFDRDTGKFKNVEVLTCLPTSVNLNSLDISSNNL